MNKQERKVILGEINRLIDRMDRREARLDGYNPEIDSDKIRIAENADIKDQAKLDGIDFVLGYLGYKRRWNPETGKQYLTKWNGYEYQKID